MAAVSNATVTTSSTGLGQLAEASAFHTSILLAEGSQEKAIAMLEKMITIRAAEELLGDMITAGMVKCPCHLAIGQEAPAVGVAVNLRPTDRVFGAHRSHGHYLALGGALHGLFAEVLGRSTGVSGGLGGSMHLTDRDHGLLGTVPIVAATIPIAVGAALAAKMDGAGDIAVSFFGDGATEEGVFHESMNLAAVLKVPVLFVCENNLFSSHLHIDLRQPSDSVSRYAAAHRIDHDRLDGNDVLAVAGAVSSAVEDMRKSNRPHFLELVTYRWRGHVGPSEDEDVGVRRKDDLAVWKGRDPIARLEKALTDAEQIEEGTAAAMWKRARAEISAAWEEALTDPFPTGETLLDIVYSPGAFRHV
jgi:TPP-dependent pyruvate/acetoin dehydrogenase alpha subunit